VCDIPLHTTCDYNVSRARCKELGCCFYQSICYEKVMPIYVHMFSTLVVIISAALVPFLVHKKIHERRKKKEILMQSTLPPEASNETAKVSQGGQVVSQPAS
ncbi:hypothetical protein GW7_00281, partial [Heterocephalus glaber]